MDIIYRYDSHSPIATEKIKTPKDSIQSLEDGHERFRTIIKRVVSEMVEGIKSEPFIVEKHPLSLGFSMSGAPPQVPHALVLGCSDARVPVERIFDHPQYGMFVVRVAGNVLGTECLGSIDYAVQNIKSLKLVLVLGHSDCGAATAAVNSYLSPHDFPELGLSHALRSLVDRLQIAVRGAEKSLERCCGTAFIEDSAYRKTLIEATIYINTALTAFDVKNEIKNTNGEVEVVHGVYDVTDQRVRSLPRDGGESEGPLFGIIPTKAESLTDYGDRVVWAIAQRDGLPTLKAAPKTTKTKTTTSTARASAKSNGRVRKPK